LKNFVLKGIQKPTVSDSLPSNAEDSDSGQPDRLRSRLLPLATGGLQTALRRLGSADWAVRNPRCLAEHGALDRGASMSTALLSSEFPVYYCNYAAWKIIARPARLRLDPHPGGFSMPAV